MSTKEELDALYLKALKAQEDGKFKEALRLFRQGAALGDDAAMNAIGLAYDSGEGVKQDKNQAIVWFKKAYRTGKQSGYLTKIALTYIEKGRQDRAFLWWQNAIAQGDGEAALGFAKFLMKSEKVLGLLRMAAACEAPLHISPAGKEEAEVFLAILTRANWDEEAK